jgi:type IV secretory pathway protease TraF
MRKRVLVALFVAIAMAAAAAVAGPLERLSVKRSPIPALGKAPAKWVKPELVVGVRHLRGSGGLRHATVRRLGGDS